MATPAQGPWTKYQYQQDEQGPWKKYDNTTTQSGSQPTAEQGPIGRSWDYLKGEMRGIGQLGKGMATGTAKLVKDIGGPLVGGPMSLKPLGEDFVGMAEPFNPMTLIHHPEYLERGIQDPEIFTQGVGIGASVVAPSAKGIIPPEGAIAGDVIRFPMKARSAIGDYIHTPEGDLTTGAKLGSRMAGGTVGAATGAGIGSMLPLPYEGGIYGGGALGYKLGAQAGPYALGKLFPESSERMMMREEPEASAMAERVQNERARSIMKRGQEEETVSRSAPSGSAQDPFEPLVWESPEEAAARDFRMRNLERQARSAGMYSAAQGSVRKPLNYQQRIARRIQK